MRYRPPSRRTVATCVVALLGFVCGQMGALFHEAHVHHVRCPEHGEWIHAKTDNHGQSPHVSVDDLPEVALHAASDHASDAHETHAHCSLVFAEERPCTLLTAPVSFTALMVWVALTTPFEVACHPIDCLHLAPKNSPPLV